MTRWECIAQDLEALRIEGQSHQFVPATEEHRTNLISR
jgi:hypothetical protein